MASPLHYDHPPIVEAVIDVKFDEALPEKEFHRLRDRFKTNFPSVEEKKAIHVELTAQGVVTNSTPAGFKMTAKNAVDLVLINQDSFGTERLAPYDRWENLIAAAKANFDLFTKVVGRKKVVRLGVRFINRIDIPKSKMEDRPLTDFITLGIDLPGGLAKQRVGHTLAVSFIEASTGAKVVLQSGHVLPVLLDHISYTLDIDASWDHDVSNRIDEMWDSVELLRTAKNACFESCITDELRVLFR